MASRVPELLTRNWTLKLAALGLAVLLWSVVKAEAPVRVTIPDVPVEVAEERRRARGGLEEMFETRELQTKLCAVYGEAERLVPRDRVQHVLGVGAVSDVAASILNAVMAVDPAFFVERSNT